MAYNIWQVHWNAEVLLLWAKQLVCGVHPFPAPWRVSPTSHRLHPDRLSKNLSHLPLSVIYTHMLLNALNKEYMWCNFLTTDNTSAAPCWWVKNAYSTSLSPHSSCWYPGMKSFLVSRVTTTQTSVDGRRWRCTCVWIPSRPCRCLRWPSCALHSSAASLLSCTTEPWVSHCDGVKG